VAGLAIVDPLYREPRKSLPPATVAPGRSRRVDGCGIERDELTLLAGHNDALGLLVRPSFGRATED
jgi:hypothetical protein